MDLSKRLSVADLGEMPIPDLYKLHQQIDREVVAEGRSYQQDIHDVLVAKEEASRRHGPAELVQVVGPGPDQAESLMQALRRIPADVLAKALTKLKGESDGK